MKLTIHPRHRTRKSAPCAESLKPRRLLSFVVDPTNSHIDADAYGGGPTEQEVHTNPAHAEDSSSYPGGEAIPPYTASSVANDSYQATSQQITLHSDSTRTFISSDPDPTFGVADGEVEVSFSLTAAASVEIDASISTTGNAVASWSFLEIGATSGDTHQTLDLSAGNYGIQIGTNGELGDANDSGSVDVTLTLGAETPPQITSANAFTFHLGQPSTFTVKTTGNPTPSITETAILPDGITFVDNGDGTATLSGTPDVSDATGDYDLIFTASNGVSPDATHLAANQFFTLTLKGGPVAPNAPPKFTSTVKSFTYHTGQAAAYTFVTTGSPTPALSVKGPLPAGLSFQDNHDGTASLFGQPTANAGGKYKVVIVATDGLGHTVQQSITIQVIAPVQTPQDFTPKPVIPARPVISGSKKNKSTVIFHNSRLESFSGAFGLSLYASPSQSYSVDTAIPLAQTSVKLKVGAAKDKSVPITFSAPIAVAAGNYYLVAVFDDNTVGFSDNAFHLGDG